MIVDTRGGRYDESQARSANLEGTCSLMQRNASTFAPILSSNSAVFRGNPLYLASISLVFVVLSDPLRFYESAA